ncbi:hypothetical protein S40288_10380 [Stachybotrys chartarum IBT 40288]|nr:hypothetical protein S40288_10380 [Stachybotrys chartarum IBT 40288]
MGTVPGQKSAATQPSARWENDNTLENKIRKGRPEILTETEKRYIIRAAKSDRAITYDALVDHALSSVSSRTIRRTVRRYFARKWKAMRRPILTKETAKLRLAWCRRWLPDVQLLFRAIFTDETTIQNASDNPEVWYFRNAHEKYRQDLVNPTVHIKPTISLMWWAGIWDEGRTSIIKMRRDPTAPRKGYSSKSYCDTLQEGLLLYVDPTCLFQQDNASIHTSGMTSWWLQEHMIEYIDWPLFSPDLNPIENAWRMLKARLRRLHPEMCDLKDNIADKALLERWVAEAWDSLDQGQIRGLIATMDRRLRAVIQARGWYTKC